MAKLEIFYDYICPHCKTGYEYVREIIGGYPGIEVEWLPVELYPAPENHSPRTDLCGQSYYAARELGADMEAFHAAMYQAAAVEGRDVENAETLAGIVKKLVCPEKFLALLRSDTYRPRIEENNRRAYEENGVWYVPAFRMNGKKLDARGGIGVSREELRKFLDQGLACQQSL